MKRKLTATGIFILNITWATAQKVAAPVKPPLIAFHYNAVDYNSPDLIKNTSLNSVLKQGNIFNPFKQAPAFTVSYWKGLSKNTDISGKLNGIFSKYGSKQDDSSGKKEFGSELEAALNFRPGNDAHIFLPFLTAGIGGGQYAGKLGAYVPLGLGLQFNFHTKSYIFLQTQFRATLSKKVFPDNLFHSLGVAVTLPVRKHIALQKIPIVEIHDRDGDGVLDSLDKCPDVLGLVDQNGCPDRDGDGIIDMADSCEDIPGTLKYHGCPAPDKDKDGIIDEEDKCPEIQGVLRYQGCPIPDTDGDGLNDELDKCPAEPGLVSNFGCPEISREIIEKINLAAKNIFFATQSSTLLPKSYESLDKIVQVLRDNTSYKVQINGHTDSTGNRQKNLILSKDRANSVKNYLISKGIQQRLITTTGFGPDQPIAPNKTSAGRAQNRRVEIKLAN